MHRNDHLMMSLGMLAVAGCSAAFADTGDVSLSDGWLWDRLIVINGKPGESYTIQVKQRDRPGIPGMWENMSECTGTAGGEVDASGQSIERILQCSGGDAYQSDKHQAVRIKYDSQQEPLPGVVPLANQNVQIGPVPQFDQGGASSISGYAFTLLQNTQDDLDEFNPGWLVDNSTIQIRLGDAFTWADVPNVASSDLSGLILGDVFLSDGDHVLNIDVLSNQRTDALASISITSGEVNYDGSGLVGDHFASLSGSFVTTIDGEQIYLEASSGFRTFSVVPSPASLSVLFAGFVGGLNRRRR